LNISRHKQCVLHVLAQGGTIHFKRVPNGKVRNIRCFTRDGHVLADRGLLLFDRLKERRLIKSRSGYPCRATRLGISFVNSQHDNL
jgi:uncharacterized protein